METKTPIAPTGFSFEDSISVEPAETGYGAPRTFTLADSFYDAHANDVFLQRKEQVVSVEPVPQVKPPNRRPLNLDPVISDEPLDGAAWWPDENEHTIPPPRFYVPPQETTPSPQALVPTAHQVNQKRMRQHMSPEARMVDSFRIPVVATIVFTITMIAIFYLGSQVAGYYAPVVQGSQVEFVGRPSKTL